MNNSPLLGDLAEVLGMKMQTSLEDTILPALSSNLSSVELCFLFLVPSVGGEGNCKRALKSDVIRRYPH
jgi:hypothetical protein